MFRRLWNVIHLITDDDDHYEPPCFVALMHYIPKSLYGLINGLIYCFIVYIGNKKQKEKQKSLKNQQNDQNEDVSVDNVNTDAPMVTVTMNTQRCVLVQNN